MHSNALKPTLLGTENYEKRAQGLNINIRIDILCFLKVIVLCCYHDRSTKILRNI